MKASDQQISIYYDPESSRAKKVLAYARALSNHIQEVEYNKTKITSTMWEEILELLDMDARSLLNKSHPYYQQNLRGKSFSDEDWLHIIMKNPGLIKAPIVIKGKRAVLCCNPTDILQLS